MSVTVWLGNPAPVDNPDHPGERWVVCAPHDTLTQFLHDLTHPNGIWAAHSQADAPSWVAATDPDWATALGAALGCPVRDQPPEG